MVVVTMTSTHSNQNAFFLMWTAMVRNRAFLLFILKTIVFAWEAYKFLEKTCILHDNVDHDLHNFQSKR